MASGYISVGKRTGKPLFWAFLFCVIDNRVFYKQTSTRKEKKRKTMRKLCDIVAAVSLLTIIGLAVLATKGGRYAQYRIMR